jgi:outer membrane protein
MKNLSHLCVFVAFPALAQTSVTLREAVEQARNRYPSVRVSVERISEAGALIRLARTAYLPKVDTIAQINRATRNNVYGMLLPQNVIAPISGPPNPNNSGTNVWGSAVGFLVSWEPADFGLRKASVEAAEASQRRVASSAERTRFEVGLTAADAYLTILAAQQTATAAKAGVDRAKTLDELVGALARANLRPGADAARALADYAAAQAALIQAAQAVDIARASLGQFLGVPGSQITVSAGNLLATPPDSDVPAAAPAHPVIAEQRLAIEESQARLRVLDRSYFPRLNVQAATYARGTGANADFTTGGAASGLGPNIYNWGLGLSLSFPLMDYAGLRARKQVEQSRERAESARMDQIRTELDAAREKAAIQVEAARRIAATTPVQLEAARAAQTQAGARYKAGLGTLADVADAERLLTQAEIDDSLARLSVWRAILARRAAEGDIEPFLQAAGR